MVYMVRTPATKASGSPKALRHFSMKGHCTRSKAFSLPPPPMGVQVHVAVLTEKRWPATPATNPRHPATDRDGGATGGDPPATAARQTATAARQTATRPRRRRDRPRRRRDRPRRRRDPPATEAQQTATRPATSWRHPATSWRHARHFDDMHLDTHRRGGSLGEPRVSDRQGNLRTG